MQLRMLCMYKDLRISAEGRLAPISKLCVFNYVTYLMQNRNIEKRQIHFNFSCASDFECTWERLHYYCEVTVVFVIYFPVVRNKTHSLFPRWHTYILHLT